MAIGDEALLKRLANHFAEKVAEHEAKKVVSILTSLKMGEATGARVPPSDKVFQDTGTIKSLKHFRKSLDILDDNFKPLSEKIINFKSKIIKFVEDKEFMPGAMAQQAKREILLEAGEFAKAQSGIYKQLAQSTIKYVEKDNTSIKKLKDVINELEDARTNIHHVANTTKPWKDKFLDINSTLGDLRDAFGKRIPIYEQLTKEEQEIFQASLEGRRLEHMTAQEATKARNNIIIKISDMLEGSAESVAGAGEIISERLNALSDRFKTFSRGLMTAASAAFGAGMFQVLEDSVFKYQANIGREYKAIALTMGMTHRELQLGMLEYRDTLRTEAALLGTGIYSDAMDRGLKNIHALGRTFMLVGDEAFRFGMQVHESARLLGMSGELNAKQMAHFFNNSAKKFNMTVDEFSNYFNTLVKDPAFVGYINSIRVTGENLQDVLEREIDQRIKMNKIMGLTIENMQQRLALENAKKWGPIIERYRSKIGATQLIGRYEKELGMAFSSSQKEALKAYAFDPSLMTKEQEKTIKNLMPMLISAPAQVAQKYQDMLAEAVSPEEERRIREQQSAMTKNIIGIFGEMAGDLIFDPKQGEQVFAAVTNGTKKFPTMNVSEIAMKIAEGDEGMSDELKELLDTVSGEAEQSRSADEKSKDLISSIDKNVDKIYTKTQQILTGIIGSGAVKAISGLAGATLQIGMGLAQLSALRLAILGSSGKLGGVMSGIDALILKQGKVLSFLRVGLAGAIGTAVGSTMYHFFKDDKWFAKGTDALFDGFKDVFTPFYAGERKRLTGEEPTVFDSPELYKRFLEVRIGKDTSKMSHVEIMDQGRELRKQYLELKRFMNDQITQTELEENTQKSLEELLKNLNMTTEQIAENIKKTADKTEIIADETVCSNKEKIANRIERQKEIANLNMKGISSAKDFVPWDNMS